MWTGRLQILKGPDYAKVGLSLQNWFSLGGPRGITTSDCFFCCLGDNMAESWQQKAHSVGAVQFPGSVRIFLSRMPCLNSYPCKHSRACGLMHKAIYEYCCFVTRQPGTVQVHKATYFIFTTYQHSAPRV
jgi:hypothetical protein